MIETVFLCVFIFKIEPLVENCHYGTLRGEKPRYPSLPTQYVSALKHHKTSYIFYYCFLSNELIDRSLYCPLLHVNTQSKTSSVLYNYLFKFN